MLIFAVHSAIALSAYAHAVFDVVVDDEVQLLFSEAVVFGQDFVDFVDGCRSFATT